MEQIRIIMTECKSSLGTTYVDFREEDTDLHFGEVDRVYGKYVIFAGTTGWLTEIGSRTRKESAIKFLQEHIRSRFVAPVEFEWE